jgi:hypothetical protein
MVDTSKQMTYRPHDKYQTDLRPDGFVCHATTLSHNWRMIYCAVAHSGAFLRQPSQVEPEHQDA